MNEAINLDEIKRHIQCCIDTEECLFCSFFRVGCDKRTFAKLMMEAVRQLEAQVPYWISVEEQTPETGDLVLVIANGKPRENIELRNAILIASYWAEEGWIADGFDGWDSLKVSHWMPLPEPPKEG